MMANQEMPKDGSKDLGLENEGEGNKTAARHYNEATQKYVESGRVEQAAEEAAEALDGPEGDELRRAEEEGKSHADGPTKKAAMAVPNAAKNAS
jgi:hypothetical protein